VLLGQETPVSRIGYDAAAKERGALWTGVRPPHSSLHVHPTLRISCEAVPPPVSPAGHRAAPQLAVRVPP
jgi:hypothetical protein